VAVAEISVDDLAERLAHDPPLALRLIDVREVDEYQEAHVPGAELVVLATVPDHVDRFVGEGETYVICRSGARSRRACEFLAAQGVEAINVAGGTMAWMTSGRPVVSGDSPS
jgi:rhodanese-related sulfurtransferase